MSPRAPSSPSRAPTTAPSFVPTSAPPPPLFPSYLLGDRGKGDGNNYYERMGGGGLRMFWQARANIGAMFLFCVARRNPLRVPLLVIAYSCLSASQPLLYFPPQYHYCHTYTLPYSYLFVVVSSSHSSRCGAQTACAPLVQCCIVVLYSTAPPPDFSPGLLVAQMHQCSAHTLRIRRQNACCAPCRRSI